MTSKTRQADQRTESTHAAQAEREGRCGHEWRYPKVGGAPRRVCRRCKRVEWLDKPSAPDES